VRKLKIIKQDLFIIGNPYCILYCCFSVNVPTPIVKMDLNRQYPLCITPDITDCTDIPDGTKLIYKEMPYNDCNHERMLFHYQPDGTLVHKCSTKKVCPDSEGILQVSSQCGVDESKFERTEVCCVLFVYFR